MAQQYTQVIQEQFEPETSQLSARRFATRLRKLYLLLNEAIQGIEDAGARSRYASLLIYRLMFMYFWPHAGEHRYWQQRLDEGQEPGGMGFYRAVLRPCFAGEGRWKKLPFSPTTLFTSHTIEQSFPALAIPDKIFAHLFALFEEQRRQINKRPGERECAAEIYGDLMAQTLQPEEMGSYYTPREITMYIARNTLFPALLMRVRERCKGGCSPDGLLWHQLTRAPDHYLFPAARKGCAHPLPPEVAAGLHDLTQRRRWQENAPEQYALPGETWRAVIARRAQTAEILASLRGGEQANLDRLTTWNVNQPL